MVNLAHYAEIKTLLAEVTGLADDLSPTERDLFHTLSVRYEELVTGTFDDKICLEVMLRNVEIRKGYGLNAGDATRRIDLPREPGEAE